MVKRIRRIAVYETNLPAITYLKNVEKGNFLAWMTHGNLVVVILVTVVVQQRGNVVVELKSPCCSGWLVNFDCIFSLFIVAFLPTLILPITIHESREFKIKE